MSTDPFGRVPLVVPIHIPQSVVVPPYPELAPNLEAGECQSSPVLSWVLYPPPLGRAYGQQRRLHVHGISFWVGTLWSQTLNLINDGMLWLLTRAYG